MLIKVFIETEHLIIQRKTLLNNILNNYNSNPNFFKYSHISNLMVQGLTLFKIISYNFSSIINANFVVNTFRFSVYDMPHLVNKLAMNQNSRLLTLQINKATTDISLKKKKKHTLFLHPFAPCLKGVKKSATLQNQKKKKKI